MHDEKPDWVTFDVLNAERFARNPISVTKLRRWCRESRLPACRMPDGWRVDLNAFDAQCSTGMQQADIEPQDVPDPVLDRIQAKLRA